MFDPVISIGASQRVWVALTSRVSSTQISVKTDCSSANPLGRHTQDAGVSPSFTTVLETPTECEPLLYLTQ